MPHAVDGSAMDRPGVRERRRPRLIGVSVGLIEPEAAGDERNLWMRDDALAKRIGPLWVDSDVVIDECDPVACGRPPSDVACPRRFGTEHRISLSLLRLASAELPGVDEAESTTMISPSGLTLRLRASRRQSRNVGRLRVATTTLKPFHSIPYILVGDPWRTFPSHRRTLCQSLWWLPRDRTELLKGALEALNRVLRQSDGVIVVDSASQDAGRDQSNRL